MTVKELTGTLKQVRRVQAYSLWKQAYLITLGISDLLSDGRPNYPATPADACPELYPPKPSIKKPDTFRGKIGGKIYG